MQLGVSLAISKGRLQTDLHLVQEGIILGLTAAGGELGKRAETASQVPLFAAPSESGAVAPTCPQSSWLLSVLPPGPQPGGKDSIDSGQVRVPKTWHWLGHDPQARVTVKRVQNLPASLRPTEPGP